MKIKAKDLKSIRLTILEQQGFNCAICGVNLKDDIKNNPLNIHLDHDHETGYIRGTVCRMCNLIEGKAWNSYCRQTKKVNRKLESYLDVIHGLYFYYDNHTKKNLIHPTFKTSEEKKLLAKKRRKRKKNLKNKQTFIK